MKTTIQELIHFITNDKMQSSYTKEQIIELLTFKLEAERNQIIKIADDYDSYLSWAHKNDVYPSMTAEQYYYSIIEIIL